MPKKPRKHFWREKKYGPSYQKFQELDRSLGRCFVCR